MSDSTEEKPTRLEIRQVLANPSATEEEKLYMKLVLLRRIASTPEKIRKVIDGLQPALAAEMSERHPSKFSVEQATWANTKAAEIEALLKRAESQTPEVSEHDWKII